MYGRTKPLHGLGRACIRPLSNSATPKPVTSVDTSNKKPNRLMQFYLDKRRQHDEFIAKERSEFELGKKHLANMMGIEANSMTQEDIDKAIEYLFPSGLEEPKAKPIMKPPEEVFPKQKATEFDNDGRPYHPFFFTQKPQFTQILYEMAEHINNITSFGERMYTLRVTPNPAEVLDENSLSASRWMTRDELSNALIETVREPEYNDLINGYNRLIELPFSYKAKEFIFKYRLPLGEAVDATSHVPQPEFDVEGRSFAEFVGQRKSSVAKVKVVKPGSGQFVIRHVDHMDVECDITYFFEYLDRHQVMFPLQFTRLLGLVDVECTVDAGGNASQAGAIRYALSMCLRSFVDENMLEDMKVCGLLTQDVRVRERKKYGQEGARRKFTWKKR